MPLDVATPTAADRNLLFGILALQMDFISRDALITAMNAWVLAKEKSLGQILSEQGALKQADRDPLEVLIKRHVQMHGDDIQKSLAALNSVEPHVQNLFAVDVFHKDQEWAKLRQPSQEAFTRMKLASLAKRLQGRYAV